ncbi:MAG: hypothetical protein LCH32_02635 [Bacteroidetes bacterium]|uniref:hypothetical protein n=1 Tax=Flavobacterium filum TaxID=370974 RepID=UPI0023F16477|nr:hypothetical protein [Flavobacterium filum]MCA0429379.1 hypothetical protein [Bacteroidota bacterium]
MSNSDLNKIKAELDKIYREFKDFQTTINDLLSKHSSDSASSTITRGAMTSAGANAEIILKYILDKEGIAVIKNRGKQAIDQNPNKPATLDDYIYTLESKGILPKEVRHHLGTIQIWRNHSAHGNFLDKIDDSTIETINGAVKSLTRWFFEDYLNGEYAEYSIGKKKIKAETESSDTKREFDKKEFQIAPDYSILSKSKKVQKRKSKAPAIILILVVLVGLYFSYDKFFANNSATNVEKSTGITDKEEAYDFIVSYFNSLNEKGYNADRFFASEVSTFYTKHNLNPTEIDVTRQLNTEFIDNKHAIDKESFKMIPSQDGINYWQFWADYVCYRPSKKKFQSCRVLMEFGINGDRKITSIKEIEIQNLKYSKSKPF